MADFNKCIKFILKHEGGYVDNPDDPGKKTKYGISKKQYPKLDIKNITIEEATRIYRNDYWNKIQGDKIEDDKLALQIFDFAVNAGVKRAVKLIQRICFVKIDGIMGPLTLKSINSTLFYMNTLEYKLGRIEYYTKLAKRKSLRQFLYSWIKRTLE